MAENPFPIDYCPKMDISNPLDSECSSSYQHLIGVMRRMVELGRVDIATKISILSSRGSGPRFVKFSNGPNTNSECSNLLN